MSQTTYKTLKNLSDAELLEALNGAKGDPSERVKNDIKSTHQDLYLFISTFSLESGENTVSQELIWQLYKSWSKKPVPKREFLNFIKKLLDHNGTNLLLNTKLFNLSKELEDYLNSKIKHKVKYDSENKHFTNFLKKYIIEDGKDWVSVDLLFDAYRIWVKQIRKANTIGPNQFEDFCKHYFKYSETKTSTKVALNVERVQWPKTEKFAKLIKNQEKK